MADEDDKNKFGEDAGGDPTDKEKEEIIHESEKRLDAEYEKLKKDRAKVQRSGKGSKEENKEDKRHKELMKKFDMLINSQEEQKTNATNFFERLDKITKENEKIEEGKGKKSDKQIGLLGNISRGLNTGLRSAGRKSPTFKILSELVQITSSLKKGISATFSTVKNIGGKAIGAAKGAKAMPKKIMGIKDALESKFLRKRKIEKLKGDVSRRTDILSATADEIESLGDLEEEGLTPTERAKRKAKHAELTKKAKFEQAMLGAESGELSDVTAKEFLYQKGLKDPERYGPKSLGEGEGDLLTSKLSRDIHDSIMEGIGEGSIIDNKIKGIKDSEEEGTETVSSVGELNKSISELVKIIGGGRESAIKTGVFETVPEMETAVPEGTGTRVLDKPFTPKSEEVDPNVMGNALVNTRIPRRSVRSRPMTVGHFISGIYYQLEGISENLGKGTKTKTAKTDDSGGGLGLGSLLAGSGIAGLLVSAAPILAKLGLVAGALTGITKLGQIITDTFMGKGDEDFEKEWEKKKAAGQLPSQIRAKEKKERTTARVDSELSAMKEGIDQSNNVERVKYLMAQSPEDKRVQEYGKARINKLQGEAQKTSVLSDVSLKTGTSPSSALATASPTGTTQPLKQPTSTTLAQSVVKMDTVPNTGTDISGQEVFAELIATKMVEKLTELLNSETYGEHKKKEIGKTAKAMNSAVFP